MPSSSSSWGAMGSRPKINPTTGHPRVTPPGYRDSTLSPVSSTDENHLTGWFCASVPSSRWFGRPRRARRCAGGYGARRTNNQSSACFGEEERKGRRWCGARASGVGERVVYGSSHALMLRFYGLRRTLKGTYVFCDVASAPGRPRAPPGGRPPTRSSESASPSSSSIIPPSTGSRTCSTCRRCSWARPRFVFEFA